jgi:hypothetical protein
MPMDSSPEYQPDCRTNPSGMVRESEAQATVEPKRIAELMIEATKGISPRRDVGLRIVLTKDFRVQTCVLVKMIAERERLLAAVVASGSRLTLRLY